MKNFCRKCKMLDFLWNEDTLLNIPVIFLSLYATYKLMAFFGVGRMQGNPTLDSKTDNSGLNDESNLSNEISTTNVTTFINSHCTSSKVGQEDKSNESFVFQKICELDSTTTSSELNCTHLDERTISKKGVDNIEKKFLNYKDIGRTEKLVPTIILNSAIRSSSILNVPTDVKVKTINSVPENVEKETIKPNAADMNEIVNSVIGEVLEVPKEETRFNAQRKELKYKLGQPLKIIEDCGIKQEALIRESESCKQTIENRLNNIQHNIPNELKIMQNSVKSEPEVSQQSMTDTFQIVNKIEANVHEILNTAIADELKDSIKTVTDLRLKVITKNELKNIHYVSDDKSELIQQFVPLIKSAQKLSPVSMAVQDRSSSDTETALERSSSDTETALERSSSDTETALERSSSDTETALERSSSDAETVLSPDIESAVEIVAVKAHNSDKLDSLLSTANFFKDISPNVPIEMVYNTLPPYLK